MGNNMVFGGLELRPCIVAALELKEKLPTRSLTSHLHCSRNKMLTWTLIQKSCQLLLHYGKNCLCISVKRSYFSCFIHIPSPIGLKPQTNHACFKGQQGMRNDCKTSRRKAEPSIILTEVDINSFSTSLQAILFQTLCFSKPRMGCWVVHFEDWTVKGLLLNLQSK